MEGEVPLNEILELLEDLEYPIQKGDAVDATAGVTVEYADGTEPLAAIVDRSNAEAYESAEELQSEIFGNVSIGAVGEPGQSEGDA